MSIANLLSTINGVKDISVDDFFADTITCRKLNWTELDPPINGGGNTIVNDVNALAVASMSNKLTDVGIYCQLDLTKYTSCNDFTLSFPSLTGLNFLPIGVSGTNNMTITFFLSDSSDITQTFSTLSSKSGATVSITNVKPYTQLPNPEIYYNLPTLDMFMEYTNTKAPTSLYVLYYMNDPTANIKMFQSSLSGVLTGVVPSNGFSNWSATNASSNVNMNNYSINNAYGITIYNNLDLSDTMLSINSNGGGGCNLVVSGREGKIGPGNFAFQNGSAMNMITCNETTLNTVFGDVRYPAPKVYITGNTGIGQVYDTLYNPVINMLSSNVSLTSTNVNATPSGQLNYGTNGWILLDTIYTTKFIGCRNFNIFELTGTLSPNFGEQYTTQAVFYLLDNSTIPPTAATLAKATPSSIINLPAVNNIPYNFGASNISFVNTQNANPNKLYLMMQLTITGDPEGGITAFTYSADIIGNSNTALSIAI